MVSETAYWTTSTGFWFNQPVKVNTYNHPRLEWTAVSTLDIFVIRNYSVWKLLFIRRQCLKNLKELAGQTSQGNTCVICVITFYLCYLWRLKNKRVICYKTLDYETFLHSIILVITVCVFFFCHKNKTKKKLRFYANRIANAMCGKRQICVFNYLCQWYRFL